MRLPFLLLVLACSAAFAQPAGDNPAATPAVADEAPAKEAQPAGEPPSTAGEPPSSPAKAAPTSKKPAAAASPAPAKAETEQDRFEQFRRDLVEHPQAVLDQIIERVFAL